MSGKALAKEAVKTVPNTIQLCESERTNNRTNNLALMAQLYARMPYLTTEPVGQSTESANIGASGLFKIADTLQTEEFL